MRKTLAVIIAAVTLGIGTPADADQPLRRPSEHDRRAGTAVHRAAAAQARLQSQASARLAGRQHAAAREARDRLTERSEETAARANRTRRDADGADSDRSTLEARFRGDDRSPAETRRKLSSVDSSNDVPGHEPHRQALEQAEHFLSRRLAQIDHLRDIALDTANTKLLQEADRMERDARVQYDHRIALAARQHNQLASDTDAEVGQSVSADSDVRQAEFESTATAERRAGQRRPDDHSERSGLIALLRKIAAKTGNTNLLKEAERMEQTVDRPATPHQPLHSADDTVSSPE